MQIDKKTSAFLRLFTRPVGKAVSLDDLISFTQQLHALFKSGIMLARGLDMLQENTTNESLRNALLSMQMSVERGNSLSKVLEDHANLFPPYYIESVRAAEAGGTLQETLLRLAGYLKSEKMLRYEIRKYFFYPRIVLACIILAGAYLAWWQDILVFDRRFFLAATSLVLIWVIAREFFREYLLGGKGRWLWDRLELRIWPVRNLFLKHLQLVFASLFVSMYRTGLPIVQLFHLIGNAIPNVVFGKEISKIGDQLDAGVSLSDAINFCPVLPFALKKMFYFGMEIGELDRNMDGYIKVTEQELTSAIRKYMLYTYVAVLYILSFGIGWWYRNTIGIMPHF